MSLVKCYAEGKTDVVAEDIMSPQIVDPEMSLKDAAAFIHSHQIHRSFVMSAIHDQKHSNRRYFSNCSS